ncbi:nodulation protein NfeD [Shewanella psychropiezotolerans]|uniref:Nodulation protein NfeD n=1 Tax=Shewanella psychropiezotolerans TaxID=2593655 RepID=A0ABX5WZP3_9GAMM|nr:MULTISPECIES: nodulation protein NfeD [Shewanella]MPY26263.1 nodulation protein NfeD [Shewanella sp. YLB-07]QDO84581.1 nodulation protein NfeD [Shewanella psychropiezotolerans]
MMIRFRTITDPFNAMLSIALFLLLFFSTSSLASIEASSQTQTGNSTEIPVLTIKGAIGPAISDYLTSEMTIANQDGAPLVIIIIDTPGGLVSSLRDINQAILNSQVPIACLVHPAGARAASAGTYILYACHIAAMAQATTLGAATPVSIGGSPKAPQDKDDNKTSSPSAMEKKILNDSIAYIRSLAQLRGRNEEWAELAVKEAATLTAQEALEKNVIDLMSNSTADLIKQLDGWEVSINQEPYLLDLSQAKLTPIKPDWRNQFIATITNPNIAYILMLIGVYGLILEFYSPGIGVAGVTGAIALVIAMYAFQMLPVNYAGLLLLMLGIGLMIAEAMVPSFGIFGIGGVIAFALGSVFLIDTKHAQFQVSLPVIAAVTAVSAAFMIFCLGYLWRSRHNKIVSGQEAIVGAEAKVLEDFIDHGFVLLGGERWAAISDTPLQKDQLVQVEQVDDLTLILGQAIDKKTDLNPGPNNNIEAEGEK